MLSDLAEYAFSENPDHARILSESARKLFIIEKLDCRIVHFHNINITRSLEWLEVSSHGFSITLSFECKPFQTITLLKCKQHTLTQEKHSKKFWHKLTRVPDYAIQM